MSKNVAILNDSNIVINIIIVNDDYELNVNEIIYTNQNPAYIGGEHLEGVFMPPKCHSEAIQNVGTASWDCVNLNHQVNLNVS
jgi:hypothetical protein